VSVVPVLVVVVDVVAPALPPFDAPAFPPVPIVDGPDGPPLSSDEQATNADSAAPRTTTWRRERWSLGFEIERLVEFQ
jgi:hypothetical protein